MRLHRLPGEVQLTYCTNIHAGETWAEIRASVAWKIPLAAPMRAPAAAVQLITTAGGKHTPLALSNRFPLDNE